MSNFFKIKAKKKQDQMFAGLIQDWLNNEYAGYQQFMEAIVTAKSYIEDAYGVVPPRHLWDGIILAGMQLAGGGSIATKAIQTSKRISDSVEPRKKVVKKKGQKK